MKKLLYLLLLPLAGMAQVTTLNYVKTLTYHDATTVSNPAFAQEEVMYMDGLGRPLQQVQGKLSGNGKDIITHFEYDHHGRQPKQYLPYEAATNTLAYDGNAQANTLAFYNTAAYENTTNPYSEQLFEASPMNRVLRQAAPGTAWQLNPTGADRSVKFAYTTNATLEVKLLWSVASWNATEGWYTNTLNSNGTYGGGQLYKLVTKDENWISGLNNTTEEFTNRAGQVVLKRAYNNAMAHDTYYVYDQFGNLSHVIPPIANGTYSDGTCYQYRYDTRNRMVAKKLPGRDWEYIVYDVLDRVVATGPAYSPFGDGAQGWMYTFYDTDSRVAATGWFPGTTTPVTAGGRKTLQEEYAAVFRAIIRANGTPYDGVATGYRIDGLGWTPVGLKLLTVNYYDDYTWTGGPTPPATGTLVENQPVLTTTEGLPTGGWVRVLTTATETYGETDYTFYDHKQRPIRTHKKNYLGGYTTTDTKLNFDGSPNYSITRHKRLNADTELTTREVFVYDAQRRLKSQSNKINSLAPQFMARNTYDALGQLVTKKVGGTTSSGTDALQFVDYSYNIRGWLKDINNVGDLALPDAPQDLFAFKINYNKIGRGHV